MRSSGFYIPAMHHRSHHAEEVVRRSVRTGSHTPEILKVESAGVGWPFRDPLCERAHLGICDQIMPQPNLSGSDVN